MMTVIHVPKTKADSAQGEDLYRARQEGASDPDSRLKHHLKINNPAGDFHLFGYWGQRNKKKVMIPLTKRTFERWVATAAKNTGLLPLQGHSIWIGSTLEYLLRGLPFNVIKVKGRWNSDAFHQYLRDHAMVLGPFMQQARPEINDQFI